MSKNKKPRKERGVCKSDKCGAVILWKLHPKLGTMQPYNEDGSSHWGTCLDLAAFRKPKKKPPAPPAAPEMPTTPFNLSDEEIEDSWGNR